MLALAIALVAWLTIDALFVAWLIRQSRRHRVPKGELVVTIDTAAGTRVAPDGEMSVPLPWRG